MLTANSFLLVASVVSLHVRVKYIRKVEDAAGSTSLTKLASTKSNKLL